MVRLQTTTGRSLGIEVRVELRRDPFYGFITCGYTNTIYAADGEAIPLWYGTEQLRYRPPHDRHHQVNVLLSTSIRGVDFSVRWQFGSGLPYTRPLAFDGFALVDDIKTAYELEHSRRVIYERPFDSILPTYHRLDVSADWTIRFRRASLTLQAGAINAYERRNIFYADAFTTVTTKFRLARHLSVSPLSALTEAPYSPGSTSAAHCSVFSSVEIKS